MEPEMLKAVCYFAIGYSLSQIFNWFRYRRMHDVMDKEINKLKDQFTAALRGDEKHRGDTTKK